jgi:hypothetical protein
MDIERDWGKQIESSVLETGLRSLQPDLHFDMGPKLGMYHPWMKTRQGVYYLGMHICSMDRGLVPEFRVWTTGPMEVPVSIHDMADEEVSLRYEILPVTTPGYLDIKSEALSGRCVDAIVRADGQVMRLRAYRTKNLPSRIVLVGWRHTFEGILQYKVPGITRQNLGTTFGVDMFRYQERGSAPRLVESSIPVGV